MTLTSTALRRGASKGTSGSSPMSQKNTIFVTVFGGVAEVDTTTVPENLEVEILDLDELEVDGDYMKKLSVEARKYAKAKGYI